MNRDNFSESVSASQEPARSALSTSLRQDFRPSQKGNKPNSNDKDQKPTGEMRRLSHAEGTTVLSEG